MKYRERIYNHYVSARQQSLTPRTLDGFGPSEPYYRQLIARHFPSDRDAQVLDLGCGTGILGHFARRAGFRNTFGVDTSPEQVAVAKSLGIEGVSQGDVMETLRSLPDASRDVVIAFDLIEHFGKDELLPLVDEIRRVLRAGGRWIIHTPNAGSPVFGTIRYGDYSHEQAFTPTSIRQLLLASGFGRVECFEDAPVAHGLKSTVRFVLWKLIRGVLRFYFAVETGDVSRDRIFTQNFLIVAMK